MKWCGVMNGKRYFEQNPWMRACSCIESQELGGILQISVHSVCNGGGIHERLHEWEKRVEQLVGKKIRGDTLSAGIALSFVGVFGDNVIVRIFVDESAEGYFENFEIVTAKSLIIWKPSNTNQGHMLSLDGCFIEASQYYVEDLEEVNC